MSVMITMTSTAIAARMTTQAPTAMSMRTIIRNMATHTPSRITVMSIPMDMTTIIHTITAKATSTRPGFTIPRMRPISIGAPCPASVAR